MRMFDIGKAIAHMALRSLDERCEFYLGEYTLWDAGTLGRIGITHSSGEGGEFPRHQIEDAIAEYFKEHF